MATYVVERYLAGWSPAEVDTLVQRMDDLLGRFAVDGVHYLRSIVMTTDETCLSLFEASDADRVRTVNAIADLPTHRIVPARLTLPHPESRT